MPPKTINVGQQNAANAAAAAVGTLGSLNPPPAPSVDTVYFRERVRLAGNSYLSGVSPDDRGWEIGVEWGKRLVSVRATGNSPFKGMSFLVPFENVSSMRLKE